MGYPALLNFDTVLDSIFTLFMCSISTPVFVGRENPIFAGADLFIHASFWVFFHICMRLIMYPMMGSYFIQLFIDWDSYHDDREAKEDKPESLRAAVRERFREVKVNTRDIRHKIKKPFRPIKRFISRTKSHGPQGFAGDQAPYSSLVAARGDAGPNSYGT